MSLGKFGKEKRLKWKSGICRTWSRVIESVSGTYPILCIEAWLPFGNLIVLEEDATDLEFFRKLESLTVCSFAPLSMIQWDEFSN